MEKSLELLGNLVLSSLGLVTPIIGVLLSIYNDGIERLSIQVESEKSKTDKNIKEQLQQLGAKAEIKAQEIRDNLRKLEKIRKSTPAVKNTKRLPQRLLTARAIGTEKRTPR